MNLKRKDYMKQHSFTDFVYEVIGELRGKRTVLRRPISITMPCRHSPLL